VILCLAALGAGAATPTDAEGLPTFTPPISEIEHPRYVDATGMPLGWRDVRSLAKGTEERRLVSRRKVGRFVLPLTFAGATALEVWGGVKLAQDDSPVAIPLLLQAAFTGTCAILSVTRIPGDRREDRALIVNAVNSNRVR